MGGLSLPPYLTANENYLPKIFYVQDTTKYQELYHKLNVNYWQYNICFSNDQLYRNFHLSKIFIYSEPTIGISKNPANAGSPM